MTGAFFGLTGAGVPGAFGGAAVAARSASFTRTGECAFATAALGGGVLGIGKGSEANLLGRGARPRVGPFLASRTARRDSGPRTGVRATKTQPTLGTGLPPSRRPSSNSQSWSPWNSW